MGDVKSRKDRPGELRLRVGKWRVFFCLEPPDFVRVLGIDNRGEATDPTPRRMTSSDGPLAVGALSRLHQYPQVFNAEVAVVENLCSKPGPNVSPECTGTTVRWPSS